MLFQESTDLFDKEYQESNPKASLSAFIVIRGMDVYMCMCMYLYVYSMFVLSCVGTGLAIS
jgi:hypothetical protein